MKNKSWANKESIDRYQDMLNSAHNKSLGFKKYTQFVVNKGHITRSASSVFQDWIDENSKNLTLKEIEDALQDLWTNTDEDAKSRLRYYAHKKGIK